MAKESTHRADELKSLGWSTDDVARYAELWDYRQRWGAINLEREDRLFLKKAEAALPVITTGKVSVKKPISEKSYYRRLSFYLEEMNKLESTEGLKDGVRGAWPILLEEEIRALDYYQPVLGLPDTIKAKALEPFREGLASTACDLAQKEGKVLLFDFEAPLEVLRKTETTSWRPLREFDSGVDQSYPVLNKKTAGEFRDTVRSEICTLIKELMPSLASKEMAVPPRDWSPNE